MEEQNNRILIVDDNQSIHKDFKKVLGSGRAEERKRLARIEQGLFREDPPDASAESPDDDQPFYEVDSAFQGEEALGMVVKAHEEGRPYALIFMDVRMPPGWDGIETIGRIWARYPETEMVICTAYSDYSWEKILAQLGANDRLLFLRKPFDTTAVKQMALSQTRKWNLSKQAERYVNQLETEIAVRKKSEARLQFLALHDALTGLANRNKFNKALADFLEAARRDDRKMALFFVDLDRFKEINDTLGYHNGDLLLKQIAQRLTQILGDRGMVSRFGGDEFAILAPDVGDQARASKLAAEIHEAIEPNFNIGDIQLEVRVSIGIVLYPEQGADEDTLMRRADMTMSVAKKSDPGYTFYDPKFDNYSPRRLMLLGELRQAIQNDDLLLHYQPKISIQTGRVIGLEALIRWRHPNLGQVYPDEFIPLAERSGLIKSVTQWVLRRAPEHWSVFNDLDLRVGISVNLSVRDLFDVRLPEKIGAILAASGMPSDQLTLEITESAMMEEPDQVKDILKALYGMGVRIAIDDFGTGYSSLAYLKNLPVNEIKIDKSFVREMDRDKDDATIVRSTVELGHTLGLSVVAEGVENQACWDMLKGLGCDYAQGYHMGRPISVEDMKAWLKESPWGFPKDKS